ncbi:hypothetical protein [Fodinicurvata sediminis]|uniref:hypothetical protein n=1 Tax=Fodinicurvata sediminis TaxID=1121832 RepID=UPI0003B56011|nr:hypothetical protein [Fodinicurvata sediminis]
MNFQWAEGFHAPKGVSADEVKEALEALPEPSPDALLEASKDTAHPLHHDLWSEGDQAWAQRGRLERCRRIIGAVQEVVVSGNRSVSIRAVEYVRPNGEGRWATLNTIRSDPDLLDAYLAEAERYMEQASAKFRRVRDMMKERAAEND